MTIDSVIRNFLEKSEHTVYQFEGNTDTVAVRNTDKAVSRTESKH